MKNLLKNIPIFSELDNNVIQSITKIVKYKKIKKEDLLFSESEKADSIFCLISGKINLIKSAANGKEQLIRVVLAKEIFAEAAVLLDQDYPVTAISQTNSELIIIEREKFKRLLSKKPEISLKIMGTMAKLLMHLNKQLGQMQLGTIENRLAKYILEKSKNNKKFTLDIKKNELAFFLGTSSETLSRTLRKFQNQKIIKMENKQINLLNIEKIREISKY